MENVVVYEWGLNSDFLRTIVELVSWPPVLAAFVAALIILYSGALAADAGERLGYNDIAFFIGGVILPYIFPLVIAPVIPAADGCPRREVATPSTAAVPEQESEPEEDVPESDDDASYEFDFFAALSTDEKGERPGPFTLTTKSGNTYTISSIRKLYPDRGVFVVQNSDANADSGEQTLRIKYEQIEYFDRLT